MCNRIGCVVLLVLLAATVPSFAQNQQPQPSSPTVTAAAVSFYPPLARVARVYGTVEVLVTVSDGVVVNTEVKSGHKLLVSATTDNIKTWRFAAGVNATDGTNTGKRTSGRRRTTSKLFLIPYRTQLVAAPRHISCDLGALDQNASQYGSKEGG